MRIPAFARAGWRSDALHAARAVLRHRSHSLGVIAGLSAGLVVSIVTFSALTSIMLGDLPGVHDRTQLVSVWVARDGSPNPVSLEHFEALGQGTPATGPLAAEAELTVAVMGRSEAISTTAVFVSGHYFSVLGTRAAAGRLLSPLDDGGERAPVAVVSDHFWRTELGGASNVIGSSILVSGRSATVVGVTEPRFHGLQPLEPGQSDAHGPQIWLPFQFVRGWPGAPPDSSNWLRAVARLQPGYSVADAQSQYTALSGRLRPPAEAADRAASVVVQRHGLGPGDLPFEILLVLAAMLSLPLTVLLIGCANIANLQLARATERAKELAVRAALGASRGQLLRLLVIETMGLALVALAVSALATAAILRIGQPYFPFTLSMDWRVAGFSTLLLAGVCLLTGLAPAWMVLRRRRGIALKDAALSGGLRHSRFRAALVVMQVALSLLMLCASGVFLRSVQALNLEVPPALRGQFVAEFDPAQIGATETATRQFAAALQARLMNDSRVSGVALSRTAEERYALMADTSQERYAMVVSATPAWFDVMGARLLAGRVFSPADTNDVAVISARLAERVAPAGSAVGQYLRVSSGGSPRAIEIIGVVSDNRMRPMVTGDRPDPVIYTPFIESSAVPFTLRVRTTAEVSAFASDLRAIVRDLAPGLPWLSLRRGEDRYLEEAGSIEQMAMSVGGLGLLALLLAAAGLYSVMAYVVQLRRREIGVRLAIGAAPRQITAMVLRQAFKLVATGAALGLGLAVPLAFGLRAIFVGTVRPLDPVAFTPPLLALLTIALVAAAVPARRASRVNPIHVLKDD